MWGVWGERELMLPHPPTPPTLLPCPMPNAQYWPYNRNDNLIIPVIDDEKVCRVVCWVLEYSPRQKVGVISPHGYLKCGSYRDVIVALKRSNCSSEITSV
nr:hypothetical protein [Nostoc sp. ChiSLP01]